MIPGIIITSVPGIIGIPERGIAPIASHDQIDCRSLAIIELNQIIVIAQDNDIGVVETLDATGVSKCFFIDRVIQIDRVTIDVNLIGSIRWIISATTVILVLVALDTIIALCSYLAIFP